MLERIAEVQGIGLLHDANGKPYTCNKVTLIYGDNGRGKSTLATIFRSASTGDVSLISNRITLDGTLDPQVVLQFGSGHKVNFAANKWSEKRTEILVFDADFIERNVHSGGAVNTNHRKNLLEFALGEAAVAARQLVDKSTYDAKTASEHVQAISAQLSGYHVGMQLTQFEKLALINDIEKKLAALENQLIAANNITAISAKAIPSLLTEPILDIAKIFSILDKSLESVHADAEQIVRKHLEKLNNEDAEGWLSRGLTFDIKDKCPFCDQAIEHNDIIKAYQTHFNAAYSELKTQVAGLQGLVTTNASVALTEGLVLGTAIATAQTDAWKENVEIPPISFDVDSTTKALQEFNDFALELIRQKQNAPADKVGSTADLAKTEGLWAAVLTPLKKTNISIKTAADLIAEYKGKLANISAIAIQQQIQQIQAAKRRHQQPVIDLIGKLTVARTSSAAAEVVKKTEREKLDALMVQMLGKYEKSINALLSKFGASFKIKGMGANFRGGAPRTEYGLLLRGKTVALEGNSPSFATALSEGDKRTLAFAFFVASTLADVKLATRTVVIDDPMCSLDVNRRQHTKTVLKEINAGAAQLIILAHDAYFLRDLRDAFLKVDHTTPISVFQLSLAANDYTSFSSCDLDKECESPYFQHHRLLNSFCNGNPCDNHAVASAVRPMLEGYLHRRFPGLISKGLMFGQVVIEIRNAVAPSPLVHAQILVSELNELNDYAGQFHHDTNPSGHNTIAVVTTELKTFASRALHVVHRGEAFV